VCPIAVKAGGSASVFGFGENRIVTKGCGFGESTMVTIRHLYWRKRDTHQLHPVLVKTRRLPTVSGFGQNPTLTKCVPLWCKPDADQLCPALVKI